jgi:hypothetical protein
VAAADIEPDRPGSDPRPGAPAAALAADLGRTVRALDGGLAIVAVGGGIGFAAGLETGLLALAAGAGWSAVRCSRAGRWLAEVRRLEWARARALVTTGLARADHRRGTPGAIERAGDAYEREGRVRSALHDRNAEPSRAIGWLLPMAERIGRVF